MGRSLGFALLKPWRDQQQSVRKNDVCPFPTGQYIEAQFVLPLSTKLVLKLRNVGASEDSLTFLNPFRVKYTQKLPHTPVSIYVSQ